MCSFTSRGQSAGRECSRGREHTGELPSAPRWHRACSPHEPELASQSECPWRGSSQTESA